MEILSNRDIENIMESYKEQLTDTASQEYRFFSLLSSVQKDDYETFSKTIIGLKDNLFIIDDLFLFLENINATLNLNSLKSFLAVAYSGVSLTKLNNLRKMIFKNSYKDYGNLNTYLKLLAQNTPNDLFFNNTYEESDNLFFDTDKFLIKPVIDYYGSKAYSGYRTAENAYWDIIDTWKSNNDITSDISNDYVINEYIDRYILQLSRDLVGHLLYRRYRNSPFGVPVLLTKKTQKPVFFSNGELDDLTTSILKESFKYISIREVYNFIDKMLIDIINYNKEFQPNFNYTNLTQLPDLVGFVNYKIDQLRFKSETTMSLDDFKELKFYLFFIFKFLKLSGIEIDQLNYRHSTIENEFYKIKELLNNLKNEILFKGFFSK